MTPLQPGLSTAGAIFTYAGNGMRGVTGDGRQATTAFFESPQGMSVDSVTGNLYVVDTYRVLRMINKTTGIITCVAGGGYTKSRGDGGLAVLATLFSPNDVAIDPLNGNIYIADGSTIRMVTKITGIITTIAGNSTRSGYAGDGGLATLATLSSPQGIDVDPNTGDLYIADSRNHAVRMIKRSTGIISTIAGTGGGGYAGDGGPATSAMFYGPKNIAIEAATGNIYITDGSTIRMVTKITGIITTIAGNSTRSGYAGDGGLATLATLSSPQGIDVDPNTGDLYIADSRNHAVRMIKRSTGIISTIAGTGEGGYAGDGGPATSAKLNVPYSVMLDASSSMMYIADQNNYVVRNIVLTPTTAVYSPSMAPTGTGIVK